MKAQEKPFPETAHEQLHPLAAWIGPLPVSHFFVIIHVLHSLILSHTGRKNNLILPGGRLTGKAINVILFLSLSGTRRSLWQSLL